MAKAATGAPVTTGRRTGPGFIGETINELKKVVWLSRRELVYLTSLVLIVAGIAGLILSGLDYGFTQLIDVLFLR